VLLDEVRVFGGQIEQNCHKHYFRVEN